MRSLGRWISLTIVFTGLSLLVLPTQAAEPVPTSDLDRQLRDALREVHNRGADLYNAQESLACYRLFDGALSMAKPLLAHRPELSKKIETSLAEAAREPDLSKRAFQLHQLIEEIHAELKPDPMPEPMPMPMPEPKPEPMVPSSPVNGTVTKSGEPIGGATLLFVSTDQDFRIHRALSEADGRFELIGIPVGKYIVVVSATTEGKETIAEKYTLTSSSPLRVEITPTTEEVAIELE